MNEEQVRKIIREELSVMMKNDQMVFSLPIQILDGRNIQVGRSVGTSFGTAIDQKIGFYGSKTTQASAIGSVGAGGADSDGVSRAAIDAILTALRNVGIIAT